MFQVNDKIHYGGSGVCLVQEIKSMRFGRTREQYYVLKPVYQNASLIYVPVDSPLLVGKMRAVLTKQEVEDLIREMPQIQTAWEDDPQLRKTQFDNLLRSNRCSDLVVLIKTLLEHKERRQSIGKTLHVADETYLREAQRLLFDEFAGALNIQPSQVNEYIRDALNETA